MEQKYVKEAFDTNWVVPLGPNVNGFEHDLEEFLRPEGSKRPEVERVCSQNVKIEKCNNDNIICQTSESSVAYVNGFLKVSSRLECACRMVRMLRMMM